MVMNIRTSRDTPKARSPGERSCHACVNEVVRSATSIMMTKTRGKKYSESYLLSLGTSPSPGIACTRPRSPGTLGRLLAIPMTTRIKARTRATRPIQPNLSVSCQAFIWRRRACGVQGERRSRRRSGTLRPASSQASTAPGWSRMWELHMPIFLSSMTPMSIPLETGAFL